MTDDITTDPLPVPETPVVPTKFCELSIHVAFNELPVVSDPNHGKHKLPVQYGPPFLRFPVNLSTEDAAILENVFSSAGILLVGFEIKDGDGHTRQYTAFTPR